MAVPVAAFEAELLADRVYAGLEHRNLAAIETIAREAGIVALKTECVAAQAGSLTERDGAALRGAIDLVVELLDVGADLGADLRLKAPGLGQGRRGGRQGGASRQRQDEFLHGIVLSRVMSGALLAYRRVWRVQPVAMLRSSVARDLLAAAWAGGDDRAMRHLLALALLIGLPATAQAADNALFCAGGTRIAAHRARLDAELPENSLGQMRATATQAPYMLEIDLSLTSDRQIVLLHDDMVDRTTDGHGAITALSSVEAAKLRLRDAPKEGLPGFETVAAWAAKTRGLTLMLDIKQVPPAMVAPGVARHRLTGRVVVLTFARSTAEAAWAADPDWLVSVLVRDGAELDAYRAAAGKRRFAAYIPSFADPALFATARKAGIAVITDAMSRGPQGSTDESGDYRAYLTERPADILVTDHARRLKACF